MPETVRMVLQSIGNARLVAEVDRDTDGTFHYQDWDAIDQWIDHGVLNSPRSVVRDSMAACERCGAIASLWDTHVCAVPSTTGYHMPRWLEEVGESYPIRTDPLPESVLDALRQSTAKAVARVRKRKHITPAGPLED